VSLRIVLELGLDLLANPPGVAKSGREIAEESL
jgi:hypothetical protein